MALLLRVHCCEAQPAARLEFLEGGEDGDGGGFRFGGALQVEAFEGVGGLALTRRGFRRHD